MKKMMFIVAAAIAAPAMAQFDYNGTGGAVPDFASSVPGTLIRDVIVADSFAITGASVMLNSLTHTWAGDFIVTIQKVGGPTATLVHRVGQATATAVGDSSDYNGTYTFANSGANIWTAAAAAGATAAIPGGTYQASGALSGGAANNAFNAFNGLNSAGTWRLTITDNAGLDTGSLGSWKLTLVPTPGAAGLAGLVAVASLRRRRA